jgi:hypothetical protein
MSCDGGHLGFPIGIKNRNLVKDIPMIILLQFGFSQFISFREEDLWNQRSRWTIAITWRPSSVVCKLFIFQISSFFSETTGPIGTKLSRNVPWMVLYKVTVFRSSRIFNMAARANNRMCIYFIKIDCTEKLIWLKII